MLIERIVSVVKYDKVKVEAKSRIGFNCIILKDIMLSAGNVVAAGSVVTKSSDPFTVIGGNPARFIKSTT